MPSISMFIPTVAALAVAALPSFADTLAAPTGPVLLTVSGDLEHTSAGAEAGTVVLDLEILKSLETRSFTTSTIWLEGDITFTGVSLRDILDYAGARGGSVSAVASNDYKVDIPLDSLEPHAPVVAYLLDGAQMSARGKGPLWLVYPYDDDAKYRTEVAYSRSIWQLNRIEAATQ